MSHWADLENALNTTVLATFGETVIVTGRIGPETVAAAAGRTDHQAVINAMLDLRLAYLQRRKNWKTFKKGWVVRIEKIRSLSCQG